MEKHKLARLKSAISFEQLLLHFNITSFNTNKKRSKCPIHLGENPNSFSWNNNTFRCFSCLESGDKLKLVQLVNNCSFQEAIKYLCDLTGTPYDPGKEKKQDYSKYNEAIFPTHFLQAQWREQLSDYFGYEKKIKAVVKAIDEISDICRKQNNEDIEFILYKLDNQLNDLVYERRSNV